MLRVRKTARPQSARASLSRIYVLLVRKTSSSPRACPKRDMGTGEVRGRRAPGSEEIRNAQMAAMSEMGHSARRTVEYRQVITVRSQRWMGLFPV
eukprot:scaffold2058_cov115-Isochrysis_galbana.AAC.15